MPDITGTLIVAAISRFRGFCHYGQLGPKERWFPVPRRVPDRMTLAVWMVERESR